MDIMEPLLLEEGALDAAAPVFEGGERTEPHPRAHPMRSDITIRMIVRGARAAYEGCRTEQRMTNENRRCLQ